MIFYPRDVVTVPDGRPAQVVRTYNNRALVWFKDKTTGQFDLNQLQLMNAEMWDYEVPIDDPSISFATAHNGLEFRRLELRYKVRNQKFRIFHDRSFPWLHVVVEDHFKHRYLVEVFDTKATVVSCNCSLFTTDGSGSCDHIAVVQNVLHSDRSSSLREWISQIRSHKFNVKVYNPITNVIDVVHQIQQQPYYVVNNISHLQPQYKIDQFSSINLNPFDSITARDYQQNCITQFLGIGRLLCCMPVGSGKTLVALIGLWNILQKRPDAKVLVVGPKSIKLQWQRALKGYLNLDSSFAFNDKQVTIVTYQKYLREFKKGNFYQYDVLIADEIQKIKNNSGKIWKAISTIKTDYFLGLSGTAIENSLQDIYALINAIVPNLLGPEWKFKHKYMVPLVISKKKITYGHQLKNVVELKKEIAPHVFVYDKFKVGVESSTTYHEVNLTKEERDTHDGYYDQIRILVSISMQRPLTFGEQAKLDALRLRCRQAACHAGLIIKDLSVMSSKQVKVLEFMQQSTSHKFVLFSEWVDLLHSYRDILSDIGYSCVMLHGSMSEKQRQTAIDRFIEDPTVSVFLSTDAGGIGIDGLQKVSYTVIHTEIPWNPARIDQRTGRVLRIGQLNDVDTHIFVSKGSIEENIRSLVEVKRGIRQTVLST